MDDPTTPRFATSAVLIVDVQRDVREAGAPHRPRRLPVPARRLFYATALEQHLRDLGVDTLIVAGPNFPNGPRATIYEASERDFRLVCAREALSGSYDQAAAQLGSIGVAVMSVDEVRARLQA